MNKIIVIGCPGSGKSTFSRKLHDITGLPLYHLDLIYHNEDKTTLSEEEFDIELDKILIRDKWIIDGNYLRSLKRRCERASAIYYLDIPIEICLDSIKSRVGFKREDMPWIEEELDEEFYEYVKNFPDIQIPKMEEILKDYDDKLIKFTDRYIADQYLKEIADGKQEL